MRRLVLVLFSLAVALELGAITATKEYVDLEVAALRANLSGARNVQDLNVYGEVTDMTKPYLADDLFPIVCDGETFNKDEVEILYFPAMNSEPPFWQLVVQNGRAWFQWPDGAFSYGDQMTFNGRTVRPSEWPRLSFRTSIQPTGDTLVTSGEIGEVTGYARAVYNYMLGNTNAWFSGTNYPDHTSVAVKHKFEFEPGMDLLSVPCSMSLMEIRDGEQGVVWDQRDWVSWYWNFKSAQMRSEIAATNEAIMAAMPRKAWGTYTASGLENPDPSTVWVDAASTTLAAGFAWQTVANVSGCAYWTIVGSGAVIGNSGTNAVLEIRDFEGKAVMRIVKGENYLAYVDSSSMTGQGRDAQGRVTFDMVANVQPVGEYSTVLETSSFVEESSSGCPVDYEWENLGDGRWRIHFLLKPGISSNACFARFKVAVQRDSTIEYTTAPTISGGLIYNGVKIAPVINGDTVTWKVVK